MASACAAVKLNTPPKNFPLWMLNYFKMTLVWGPMVRIVPSSVAVPEPMKSHNWVKV